MLRLRSDARATPLIRRPVWLGMKTGFDHHSGETIDCDGAEIYFEEAGARTGRPLVLLHGGLGSIEDFATLTPALAEYRLIGIDSRGHGKSTRGRDALSYLRLEKDMERVVNEIGLSDYSMVGFSDGGIVAYRLASREKARIHKLVTIGSRWRMVPEEPTRRILGEVTGPRWRAKFPQNYERYRELNPEPDFDGLVESISQMWLELGPDGHPNDRVGEIAAETLLVRGDQDHLLRLEEAVELKKRLKKCQFFNVPYAGHAAHEDQPKLVQLMVRDFLAKAR